MSRKALGRGIDALFRDSGREATADPAGQLAAAPISIPVDQIAPSPDQPRREFDDAAIRELADSIRRRGVLQPIIVVPSGGGYVIVAGERRWRAAREAGLSTIPAMVRSAGDQERLEIALIENLQREDLDPMEEAHAYRRLMELGQVNQEDVARLVGKDRSTVANGLRLLKLPPEAQAALSRREITPGHARALLSVVSPADQSVLLDRVVEQGLTVRQAEELAARLNAGGRASARGAKPPSKRRDSVLVTVEKELFDRFGTKVDVRGDRKRGRIEISYFSSDDLDRIVELLTKPSR